MRQEYQPPPGPPTRQDTKQNTSGEERYNPPAGPPPGWHGNHSEDYTAPPGPPPSHRSSQRDDYLPPPGPPPSHNKQPGKSSASAPPPYHDWTVIPDTALLPPPPQLSNELSPTANATEEEGSAAYQWGLQNPLWQPRPLPAPQIQAMRSHAHTVITPVGFTGEVSPIRTSGALGRWYVKSKAKTRDSCLQTLLPVFSALEDSPLQTERSKTIYFEIRILSVGSPSRLSQRSRSLEEVEAGIAIGFFAPPYLGWRLPGWQRGSLAVHGDDGRRYVNDTFGGVDFTSAFRVGETVGIGMTWKPQTSDAPPTYTEAGRGNQSPLAVDVFFTRDGRRDGGWNLHEEMDAERNEGGTRGLDGDFDVFAAVGIFGQVEVEVRFAPEDWVYQLPRDKGSW